MAASQKPVLVIGDANVDLIAQFPHTKPDGKAHWPQPVMSGGGTAANTALALRKLGMPVEFMGTLGDDQYGQMMLDELRGADIGSGGVIVDRSLHTVCVFAFVTGGGERYLWPWPDTRQSFKELDPGRVDWALVENAAWIHSTGMIMSADTSARHTVIEIFRRAASLGIPTSLDLNLRVENGQVDEGYRRAVLDIAECCSCLLGSGADEFHALHPCDDWRDSARAFVRENRTVIARMGKQGSMALTPGGEWTELPFDVPVVDTVGAGDVYNAGFIAARLRGLPLRDCIVWGNGVSSYKVARKGSRTTPDFPALKEFLQQYDVCID